MSPVAVLFGGPSPEHDVSILTGLQAGRALAGAGRDVVSIYWTKTGEWFDVEGDLEAGEFADGVPRKAKRLELSVGRDGGFVPEGGLLGRKSPMALDAVVNCCHGGPGEDGTLQAALDLAGIRYTGPSVAGAALGMDKFAFAAAVAHAGLPHLACDLLTDDWKPSFDGPFVVKPRFGGSSIGVEVVEDAGTATALLRSSPYLRAGAVVEPFKEAADDLNIAIRTYPQLELSPIEKPLRSTDGAAILNYGDKYVGGEGMASAPAERPANIPDEWAVRIREAAAVVAGLAQVRGVARLDFLAAGGELWVNEINTVPGSLTKHLWVDPAVPFADLLSAMIDEATSSPARQYDTTGADGGILRSAGSIASKLA